MVNTPGKRKKHRILRCIGIILLALVLLLLIFIAAFCIKAKTSYADLERVDEEGYFYSMTYTGNYDTPIVYGPLNIMRDSGCSAFITKNNSGEVITGRNYDFPHLDKNGDTTGLNVLVKCSPKGGYSSVGIADAALFSVIGLPYYSGSLDSGDVTTLPLMFIPYLCMDGINEKGVTVSILALDIKDGETPMYQTYEGRKTYMVNQLLREILDNCASVGEAVKLAESVNIANTFGYDYHLFVTDASGVSAVFEWRYNELKIIYTDCVTNFYVGYDDACDSYSGDTLREVFAVPEKFTRDYTYGYGHGYERFATVAKSLDEHMTDSASYTTVMTDTEAMGILKSVCQKYISGSPTSLTQYSVVYNNSSLSAEICVSGDYSKSYMFTVK